MDLFRKSSLGGKSNLCCSQSSPLAKHQIGISSFRPVHSADTTHESARAVQSVRNQKACQNGHKSQEPQEKFSANFSLQSHHRRSSATPCKENQYTPVSVKNSETEECEPMFPAVCAVIVIFLHHVSSHVPDTAKITLSPVSASEKYSFMCYFNKTFLHL